MPKTLKFDKIYPRFDNVLVTRDCYEEDEVNEYGIVDVRKRKGELKDYQTVIAAGEMAKVNVGDRVMINWLRYAVPSKDTKSVNAYGEQIKNMVSYKLDFSGIEFNVNGVDCLMILGSDIKFSFEGHDEEVKLKKPPIINTDKKEIPIFNANGGRMN